MRRKKHVSIHDNQLLAKALDRLIADILRGTSSMPEANERLIALASTYSIRFEYLQGYVWGQLVVMAQHAMPPLSKA